MTAKHLITAEEYTVAFEKLRDRIDSRQWKMLNAFLHAPHHALTATEAAKAAGYKNLQGFNSRFGALSRMFCEALNYTPEAEWDGKSCKTSVLALLLRKAGDEEYRWKLRAEVLEYLRKR